MKFSEVLEARRSVRHFNPNKPVEEYQLRLIVAAGVAAPSAGNVQPWRFAVVREADKRQRLVEAVGQKWMGTAPAIIVVSANLRQSYARYGDRGEQIYAIQDTAAAAENMLLQAVDLGLASCWVGAFDPDSVRESLGIQASHTPLAILPVGYSAESNGRTSRRILDDVTTWM